MIPRTAISVCVGPGGHRCCILRVMRRRRPTSRVGNRKVTVVVFSCSGIGLHVKHGAMGRKYISWKTKTAAALAELGNARYGIPYTDVKRMTEDQFLSLWEWDHNIFHSGTRLLAPPKGLGLKFTPLDPDVFWNLTPMPIKPHLAKTKRDLRIIAKGRRIRKKRGITDKMIRDELWPGLAVVGEMTKALSAGLREGAASAYERLGKSDRYSENYKRINWNKRKLRSRGFDKTKRRKMSGKVVPR